MSPAVAQRPYLAIGFSFVVLIASICEVRRQVSSWVKRGLVGVALILALAIGFQYVWAEAALGHAARMVTDDVRVAVACSDSPDCVAEFGTCRGYDEARLMLDEM